MKTLAAALEVLLVAGLARQMLDEFDLRVAGIGQGELEVTFDRATAEDFVARVEPEIFDDVEARDPHCAVEEFHPRREVLHHEGDLLEATAED